MEIRLFKIFPFEFFSLCCIIYSPWNFLLSHLFVRSSCAHCALTASLALSAPLNVRITPEALWINYSSCIYISFPLHSPFTVRSHLLFAFGHHSSYISAHQIPFSMHSLFAQSALTFTYCSSGKVECFIWFWQV